eukprot:350699-Chlamydomonas_euryale.AAC.13
MLYTAGAHAAEGQTGGAFRGRGCCRAQLLSNVEVWMGWVAQAVSEWDANFKLKAFSGRAA